MFTLCLRVVRRPEVTKLYTRSTTVSQSRSYVEADLSEHLPVNDLAIDSYLSASLADTPHKLRLAAQPISMQLLPTPSLFHSHLQSRRAPSK